MTIENGYCTLAEFKAEYFPPGVTTTVADSVIEKKIEAASRAIDKHCKRFFYQSALGENESESRYYTALDANTLMVIDDIETLDSLKTDDDCDRIYETEWAGTDYDLMPDNAALHNEPYTWIETAPNGTLSFPTHHLGVEITGTFGWPEVPDDVQQACLLLAMRLMARKNAPLGITGNADFGVMRVLKEDPDVLMLLEPYIKIV